jgi:hypothetical protein
MPKTEGQHS